MEPCWRYKQKAKLGIGLQGEYDKVFDTAIKLRKQVYGKNAVIDYFIAKSLCLDGL